MVYVGRFGSPWRRPPPVQAPALVFRTNRKADVGSYVTTGQDADLLHHRRLYADVVSHATTGQDADLLHTRTLPMGAESYALTGQAVTFANDPRFCPSMAATVTASTKMTNSVIVNASMATNLTARAKMTTRVFPGC